MNRIAKGIRIITIAPINALILINVIYFFVGDIKLTDYLLAIFTLVLLPILAYPVQHYLKIIPGDKRSAERKLAIIFALIGYLVGFVFSLISDTHEVFKIMYLTYLLSGALLAFFSFGLKINSSGHMCGVVGPITMIVYCFGYKYLWLLGLIIFVIWASLYLKRHNVIELLLGASTSVVALIISIIIITF